MSYSKEIETEILQKCYNNYLKTGIPKAEIIFGFTDIRTDYLDTIDEMYDNNLLKSNKHAVGMFYAILTDYGLNFANSLFE